MGEARAGGRYTSTHPHTGGRWLCSAPRFRRTRGGLSYGANVRLGSDFLRFVTTRRSPYRYSQRRRDELFEDARFDAAVAELRTRRAERIRLLKRVAVLVGLTPFALFVGAVLLFYLFPPDL